MYVDTTNNTLKIMNAIACWIKKSKNAFAHCRYERYKSVGSNMSIFGSMDACE